MDKTMTPLMPNPFLSASDGLHPLSSVAAASGGLPLQNAAAEISSAEPLSAGPAVVAGLSPGSMTTAGTNSDDEDVPAGMQGSNDCGPLRDGATSGDTMQESRPAHPATATSEADCINEIFTFARGLMRDYQPDFQALLNEIAPFPMEYLSDYQLGDDDQPLFLQGAVA